MLGICVVIGVGFSFLLFWLMRDLEPQYRKVTEEPLVDAAYTLASLAATTAKRGTIDTRIFERMFQDTRSRTLSAGIYDFVKRDVDLHVYITDKNGIVIFDSDNGKAVGSDYSRWNDVYRTLRGKYGSRTTRMRAEKSSPGIMYVAAPVLAHNDIIGVISVGKPTIRSDILVSASRRRTLIAGAAVCIAVILTTAVVSGMVTRPIKRLTEYARSVKYGKRTGFPKLGRSEIRQLGLAFEEMRDALEGKKYVEHYVQTLTHEIKSPLSAIQGAAELLREENMKHEDRQRFLTNIHSESARIRTLVDKLLLLSSLESRKTRIDAEPIDLNDIISEVLQSMAPIIENRRIRLDQALCDAAIVHGEPFLVRHAVENILQNAAEFTPRDGTVSIRTTQSGNGQIEFVIEDSGPGIPVYALDKVFERFYSLRRPDTGRKSSGLGLSLVHEIMSLHGGTVSIKNCTSGGVSAALRFPKLPAA